MSWPSDQSPGPRSKNSPDWSQRPGQYGNYRSPFPSPRNGQDFGGQSPMKKNFMWRNNSGYHRFHNDRFHYSPGGNRRGGNAHFRGRGGGQFRGSPTDTTDITLYVNPSMLSDPWKELEENLGPKMKSGISVNSEPSETSTTNSSISTSLNTNNDTQENLTEESVVISDDSSSDLLVSDQTKPGDGGQSAQANVPTPSDV